MIPNRVLGGVIVVIKYLIYTKGSNVVGGELFIARIMYLDLVSYFLLCLKLLDFSGNVLLFGLRDFFAPLAEC